jgi:hypothetical protein
MLDVILILVVGFFVFAIIVNSLNPAPTPKTPKELYLHSLTEPEITQKVNFYNNCSRELKKWADLRDSQTITEEEYQDKKEQGQYVNNAISSIPFVMKLIQHNVYVVEDDTDAIWCKYDTEILKFKQDIPNITSDIVECDKWHRLRESNRITEEEYRTRIAQEIIEKESFFYKDSEIPHSLQRICPSGSFIKWWILRKSNAITKEEYLKLKEEFLRVEGLSKKVNTTTQIEDWSGLRKLNAITEEEFQKLKVYLISTK